MTVLDGGCEAIVVEGRCDAISVYFAPFFHEHSLYFANPSARNVALIAFLLPSCSIVSTTRHPLFRNCFLCQFG